MSSRTRAKTQRLILQARIWTWDYSWSFSLASPTDLRPATKHYSERAVLKLSGIVRYPEIFKYPNVECYLHADPWLYYDEKVPLCIGSMQADRKKLTIYIAVQNERFDGLVSASNRLVALEINAEPLRYRKARVMAINLSTELEPDW